MVIIYRSNTGFTQEYAEMLGKAEKLGICGMYDTAPPAREELEACCEEITRICGKRCVIS